MLKVPIYIVESNQDWNSECMWFWLCSWFYFTKTSLGLDKLIKELLKTNTCIWYIYVGALGKMYCFFKRIQWITAQELKVCTVF